VFASTYSIAACDLDQGQWGVAVQSKFLAVGSLVAWAEAGVGAIATQALINPEYGPDGLALLRSGCSAAEALKRLTDGDALPERRQAGIVDAHGGSASHTGSGCQPFAGGRTGPSYAAQGNMLVSEVTVEAMASTFERSAGEPLAERLLAAIAAAQAAGGDRRGQQSAALLVVERRGGYGGLIDTIVDLRVDDHDRPIQELARLHELHRMYFGKTPADEWLTVDGQLAAELRVRLAAAGYDGELATAFERWAGTENLENRLNGIERIDPVVLAHLRART
jgi:uncharacterized Ntn-hydrolase superfamily protein